jgi:hypothetical protein
VLDGVKLSQHHVIFHAPGLQGDNLCEFRNGLVKDGGGVRCRRSSVLTFAQLPQVNAAQQPVRVNVVGMRFQRYARRGLGIMHAVGAKIKICQIVAQLG